MSSKSRTRIDTSPRQQPLASLGSALGNLDSSSLPAGPQPAVPAQLNQVWKLGRVVLRREKAHRGGKTVIVVDDFATHLPLSVIEKVARRLRSACGCGGTVKGRAIEMQGDQPQKIRAALETEGFQVAGVT